MNGTFDTIFPTLISYVWHGIITYTLLRTLWISLHKYIGRIVKLVVKTHGKIKDIEQIKFKYI